MDKDMTNRSIGAAIRNHRLASGIKQKALATKVGVSYQQVQKYETGKDGVSAWRLMQIAAALGVPAATLLVSTPEASPLGSRKALIAMACFQRLNPAQQDCIVDLLKTMTACSSTRPN